MPLCTLVFRTVFPVYMIVAPEPDRSIPTFHHVLSTVKRAAWKAALRQPAASVSDRLQVPLVIAPLCCRIQSWVQYHPAMDRSSQAMNLWNICEESSHPSARNKGLCVAILKHCGRKWPWCANSSSISLFWQCLQRRAQNECRLSRVRGHSNPRTYLAIAETVLTQRTQRQRQRTRKQGSACPLHQRRHNAHIISGIHLERKRPASQLAS